MHRNRFGALAVAAAAALFLFSALPGSAVPVIAQQAPWYVATGPDGTFYLVTQDGYYEITPGTLSDDQLASFRDLGPTGPVGPNGGLGPTAPTAAAPPPAPPAVPQSPPTVKPGDVLYQADWSQGMDGWTGASNWKTVGGMLVSSGGFGGGPAWAAFQTPNPDYAVEAELQAVGEINQASAWAVDARGAASGGSMTYYGGGATLNQAAIGADDLWWYGSKIVQKAFTPRNDWHKYRLEAKGNHLKLLIDGALIIESDDNRYLAGNEVGVYSSQVQVNVRNFKVIQL